MTNLSTIESNNSNGEVLDKDVVVSNNEESHIASALLGHFVEYYIRCNCAGIAPTMPLYRDSHLDSCPLYNLKRLV